MCCCFLSLPQPLPLERVGVLLFVVIAVFAAMAVASVPSSHLAWSTRWLVLVLCFVSLLLWVDETDRPPHFCVAIGHLKFSRRARAQRAELLVLGTDRGGGGRVESLGIPTPRAEVAACYLLPPPLPPAAVQCCVRLYLFLYLSCKQICLAKRGRDESRVEESSRGVESSRVRSRVESSEESSRGVESRRRV